MFRFASGEPEERKALFRGARQVTFVRLLRTSVRLVRSSAVFREESCCDLAAMVSVQVLGNVKKLIFHQFTERSSK